MKITMSLTQMPHKSEWYYLHIKFDPSWHGLNGMGGTVLYEENLDEVWNRWMRGRYLFEEE